MFTLGSVLGIPTSCFKKKKKGDIQMENNKINHFMLAITKCVKKQTDNLFIIYTKISAVISQKKLGSGGPYDYYLQSLMQVTHRITAL